MKQVYKCDFCSTNSTEEQIKEHEIDCVFNPENKHCYSCRFYIEDFLGNESCIKNENFKIIIWNKDKCLKHEIK